MATLLVVVLLSEFWVLVWLWVFLVGLFDLGLCHMFTYRPLKHESGWLCCAH